MLAQSFDESFRFRLCLGRLLFQHGVPFVGVTGNPRVIKGGNIEMRISRIAL